MAGRTSGKGKDDLAKLIASMVKRVMENKAPAHIRYQIQKNLAPGRPSSVLKDRGITKNVKPKKTATKKTKAPATPSTKFGAGEKPTTKGPKSPPKRPERAPSLKNKSVPTNDAERREAERQANFWLRNQKDLKPQRRPDRVPQSSEIPQVSSRSKSKPLGPSSQSEADTLRREAAADRRRIGPGQPSKGGRNKSGSPEKRQSSKNNPKGKNKKRPQK